MKISDESFKEMFDAVEIDKHEAISSVLEKGKYWPDGELTVSHSLYNELIKIAKEFDDEYSCLSEAGEEEWVYIDLQNGDMTISMAGDQEPYADEPSEDGDYYFDAIGTWEIDLRTKDVDFGVSTET